LHPRYRTPAFSTVLTGILVAVPSLFLNLKEVTDLTSIGTLFAFVLVSGGVLILDGGKRNPLEVREKGFRIPYINSRYILPALWALVIGLLFWLNADGLRHFFFPGQSPEIPGSTEPAFWHKIPMIFFIVFSAGLTILAIIRQLSLIPVLGLLTNLYLMTELGITNWMRFLIWLVVGLLLYFTYGYKHSKLNRS
jgi:amino acid transporter